MIQNRFLHVLTYMLLSLIILMVQVMPLAPTLSNISGPDVFVALSFAWIWRRPGVLPIWCVIVMSLLFDLMLMRPPGLGTAFLIVALEILRARAFIPGVQSLMLEWFNAAVIITAMSFGLALVTAMLFLHTGGMVLILTQLVMTVAIYPIVALGVAAICSLIEPKTDSPTP